jgi:hypothetical protein
MNGRSSSGAESVAWQWMVAVCSCSCRDSSSASLNSRPKRVYKSSAWRMVEHCATTYERGTKSPSLRRAAQCSPSAGSPLSWSAWVISRWSSVRVIQPSAPASAATSSPAPAHRASREMPMRAIALNRPWTTSAELRDAPTGSARAGRARGASGKCVDSRSAGPSPASEARWAPSALRTSGHIGGDSYHALLRLSTAGTRQSLTNRPITHISLAVPSPHLVGSVRERVSNVQRMAMGSSASISLGWSKKYMRCQWNE